MHDVISTVGPPERYGAASALEGLDLEVPPGCVLGYLGPNGAGKTTSIRLSAGLLRPPDRSPSRAAAVVLAAAVPIFRRRDLHAR